MTRVLDSVVVVGGCVAGVSAADTLRTEGFEGAITVVGDEPHTAYSRPALSKGVLRGDEDSVSVRLPRLDSSVEVRTSTRAVALDTDRRILTVEHDGRREALAFDGLVIATGVRARRLAAAERPDEFVVRDLDHSVALAAVLKEASSAVIVGGGFLALELASSIRGMGLAVTVVHTLPPLSRHLGTELARLVVDTARAAGVRFVATGPGARALEGDPCGVRLPNGAVVTSDVLVSAIGDRPNVEWLAGSGLSYSGPLEVTAGGIVRPGIVAAGDVTSTRTASGSVERTPHWHSAIAQGRAAARALLGLAAPATPTPYFWTECFGMDIKVTGRIPRWVEPTALEGSLQQREAVLQWRGPDGVPVAAATVNRRMPLVKLSRLARPEFTEVTR
jgi:3-phenylpropionate/trans-cinnamate dioxygenase ferredoxin reductase component